MKETETYYAIGREEWKELNKRTIAPLTHQELEEIRGLNDRISLEDVEDIYVPIIQLLDIFIKEYDILQVKKSQFLNKKVNINPYIIGIAGSVAVGKSTSARLLQKMLARIYKDMNVEMITTDGFLYPNEVLKEKGILNRKGFPESYDMPRLNNFLEDIKNGKPDVASPVYSHEVYNIIENEYHVLNKPDILIVEGINVLQLPANQPIYVSDFFDFSIYVDAEPEQIEEWYLERFGLLLDTAFTKPDNYYYKYAQVEREEAFNMAREVWKNINLKNLEEYILPTRNRADLIIHKGDHHMIDQLLLRKY